MGVIYPTLSVSHIQNPSRLYAVPLLGIIIKFIICIPVWIEILFLNIASGVITFINSFSVLFTGKYWDIAYDLNLGVFRLTTKIALFFFGLTNKYPGFSLSIQDELIAFDMAKPQTPLRFFAIPILGGLARFIILIPYLIYYNVIVTAAGIGSSFIASFSVLFAGKYPEFTYELAKDSVRISQATAAYMSGLSDNYPSFWISMNHKAIKIVLIVIAAIYMLLNWSSSLLAPKKINKSIKPVNYTSPYYPSVPRY